MSIKVKNKMTKMEVLETEFVYLVKKIFGSTLTDWTQAISATQRAPSVVFASASARLLNERCDDDEMSTVLKFEMGCSAIGLLPQRRRTERADSSAPLTDKSS